MRLRGDITLFGTCENEERGCWEPWLEPWTLSFSYTTAEILLAPLEEDSSLVSPDAKSQLIRLASPNVTRSKMK